MDLDSSISWKMEFKIGYLFTQKPTNNSRAPKAQCKENSGATRREF